MLKNKKLSLVELLSERPYENPRKGFVKRISIEHLKEMKKRLNPYKQKFAMDVIDSVIRQGGQATHSQLQVLKDNGVVSSYS